MGGNYVSRLTGKLFSRRRSRSYVYAGTLHWTFINANLPSSDKGKLYNNLGVIQFPGASGRKRSKRWKSEAWPWLREERLKNHASYGIKKSFLPCTTLLFPLSQMATTNAKKPCGGRSVCLFPSPFSFRELVITKIGFSGVGEGGDGRAAVALGMWRGSSRLG